MSHFEDLVLAGVADELAREGVKYAIGDKVFVAGYASWKDEFAFEVVRVRFSYQTQCRTYDLWNREYDIRLNDVPGYKLRLHETYGSPISPSTSLSFLSPPWSLRQSVSYSSARKCTVPFVPKKVIFHDPATIVLWDDGTKTVVKCSEGDAYDPEKGFMLCYFKKLLGESYYKYISKTVKKYKED
jgi:hypothetical protein